MKWLRRNMGYFPFLAEYKNKKVMMEMEMKMHTARVLCANLVTTREEGCD